MAGLSGSDTLPWEKHPHILKQQGESMRLHAILVSCILALAGLTLSAQTYSRVSLTNFVLNGGEYVAITNIAVGSNLWVQVMGMQSTTNIENPYGTEMAVQYPGGPWTYPNGLDYGIYQLQPVLGPCTIRFTAWSVNNVSPSLYVLLQYSTVNVAPSPMGVVQSPGQAVTVNLQSSTNLSIWATTTNGVYGAGDKYRFFRVNLQ